MCFTLTHNRRKCDEIYETFAVKHETLHEILDQFETYFVPKVNVSYERHKFCICSQETNMTIDQYATELRVDVNLVS